MYSDQSSRVTFEGTRISLVRPSHSLSESDVAGFVAGLAILKGTWSADRFEGCDGDASLLLAPRNVDDGALSFSVDRDASGLRLTAWRGDTHGVLGVFARAQDALGFIWGLVEAEHGKASVSDPETFNRACRLVAQAGAAPPN